MTATDLLKARQEAKRTAQLAVRTFAREPNVDHEQAVEKGSGGGGVFVSLCLGLVVSEAGMRGDERTESLFS